MKTSLALSALALVAATLAGCSSESEMRAEDPAVADAAGPDDTDTETGAPPALVPASAPAPDGRVATQGLVTVLDDGDGPELCLGPIAESLPPQCGGPEITGWDWADHPMHEEAAGVRWGSFHLTGTFDGTTFAVQEAIPAALYDTIALPPEEPLGTPCEDVRTGGVDTTRTSPEAMDATLTAASALPGYAMAWLDGNTVNVAVTEDPTSAETTLRETWSGPLCVSEAEHTQAELEAIQRDLNELPGMLSVSAPAPDRLEATVRFDDGSLQEWADETYGEGLVEVSSALAPVS